MFRPDQMQIHSLTVGGADRKAEIPCLLRYTKCCATFACHRKKGIFVFIMTPNTRVHFQNSWYWINYLLFSVIRQNTHNQVVVLCNSCCSGHVTKSMIFFFKYDKCECIFLNMFLIYGV